MEKHIDFDIDFAKLLSLAQSTVSASPLYHKFIDGTPLENDIAVWMVEFTRNECLHVHAQLDELRVERDELKRKLYEVGICAKCGEEIQHDVTEPFASCACGQGEDTGGPSIIQSLRMENAVLNAQLKLQATELAEKSIVIADFDKERARLSVQMAALSSTESWGRSMMQSQIGPNESGALSFDLLGPLHPEHSS